MKKKATRTKAHTANPSQQNPLGSFFPKPDPNFQNSPIIHFPYATKQTQRSCHPQPSMSLSPQGFPP